MLNQVASLALFPLPHQGQFMLFFHWNNVGGEGGEREATWTGGRGFDGEQGVLEIIVFTNY